MRKADMSIWAAFMMAAFLGETRARKIREGGVGELTAIAHTVPHLSPCVIHTLHLRQLQAQPLLSSRASCWSRAQLTVSAASRRSGSAGTVTTFLCTAARPRRSGALSMSYANAALPELMAMSQT